MEIWQAAWRYMTSHMNIKDFIVGIGPNNFHDYIHFSTSENQYLLELMEKGILGLVSYLILVGGLLYLGYRGYRSAYVSVVGKSLGLALFASMCFLLLHNLFSAQFRSTAPFIIMMMAAYLVRELKEASAKHGSIEVIK